MKGEAPNAGMKKWREDVRALGSVFTGYPYDIEIHHPIGRTAKHNKIPIGHQFILPVTNAEHRWLEALGEKKRPIEIGLFLYLLGVYEVHYGLEPPITQYEIAAIRSYHR